MSDLEFWRNMALGLKDEMVQRGDTIDALRAQLATAQDSLRIADALYNGSVDTITKLDGENEKLAHELAALQAAKPVGLTKQSNKRLPGDLLGRWTRLNTELEAKAEDLDYSGIHIDWSDMAVLNAYLTEDAEFAKWQRGTWDATPVADAEGVVWEPIVDGAAAWETHSISVEVGGGGLVIRRGKERNFVALPSHIRLCERRPHAQQDGQEGVQGGQPAIDARMDS